MKRLLAVLALAAAFVFGGHVAWAAEEQPYLRAALRSLAEVHARTGVIDAQRRAPLPALPVPPVMMEQGMVQAPNPRPLENFPVAKHQLAMKPQQTARPLPAIKTPPVVTEKGKMETPNPRPTSDFPVAKPQKQAPVAEIKRNKGFLDGKAVVVNQNNVTINVALSASNNLGRKAAIHDPKTGNYYLGEGTLQGWNFKPQPVKKVPPGYEIIEGREAKS